MASEPPAMVPSPHEPLGGQLPNDPTPEALHRSSLDDEAAFLEWLAMEDFGEPARGGSADADPAIVLARAASGLVDALISDAEGARVEANRAAAAQLSSIDLVLQHARRHPEDLVRLPGQSHGDAIALAVSGAVADLALRFGISEGQLRHLAHLASILHADLPRTAAVFASGRIALDHVRVIVDGRVGIADLDGLAAYDEVLAAAAPATVPRRLRSLARIERAKHAPGSESVRHTRAMADRRVVCEPADDGMAWISAFLPAADAIRIHARLTATAARDAKAENETRTRAQVEADLFAAWLAGDGTATAAKVRPILHMPILGLIGATDQPAVLTGYGPIDPATAAQLFADAPAFRRIGTDPVTGAALDLDRTRYRPTADQRLFLATRFGTCAHPGCEKLATQTDLDHIHEWYRDTGPTDEANLLPLCSHHHRLKTFDAIVYARDPDGRTTTTTRSGHRVTAAPNAPFDDLPPF